MAAWLRREEPSTLIPGKVHIWRVFLEPSGQLEALEQQLSPEELGRANRFYFASDRQHFIVAHAALRTILAGYLGLRARDLSFSITPYGKPFLTDSFPPGRLEFNLSHSGQLALIAVSWNMKIGVDIELIRPDFSGEAIARSYFSKQEVASYLALPEGVRTEAFFACWTRKEAYIKACGEGLSLPLEQFDVSLAPGEPARLLSTRPDAQEAGRWRLMALHPAAGYQAAVVVEGDAWQIECLEWAG